MNIKANNLLSINLFSYSVPVLAETNQNIMQNKSDIPVLIDAQLGKTLDQT